MTEESLIPEALLVRLAERLKALGQPVRLRLVERLNEGSSTPQELSDALGLSQQNVSKHLLRLHRAGVVSRWSDGANVIYAIEDETAVAVLRLTLDSVTRQLRELSQAATAASDHRNVRDDRHDMA